MLPARPARLSDRIKTAFAREEDAGLPLIVSADVIEAVRHETGGVPDIVHRLLPEPDLSVRGRRQSVGVWEMSGTLALPA